MSTVKSTKVIDRFKPVTRKRDMEKEMYNEIESMAKQCVEMSKDKFKDESVCFIFKHNIFNLYMSYRKLRIISKKNSKKNTQTKTIVGMLL